MKEVCGILTNLFDLWMIDKKYLTMSCHSSIRAEKKSRIHLVIYKLNLVVGRFLSSLEVCCLKPTSITRDVLISF